MTSKRTLTDTLYIHQCKHLDIKPNKYFDLFNFDKKKTSNEDIEHLVSFLKISLTNLQAQLRTASNKSTPTNKRFLTKDEIYKIRELYFKTSYSPIILEIFNETIIKKENSRNLLRYLYHFNTLSISSAEAKLKPNQYNKDRPSIKLKEIDSLSDINKGISNAINKIRYSLHFLNYYQSYFPEKFDSSHFATLIDSTNMTILSIEKDMNNFNKKTTDSKYSASFYYLTSLLCRPNTKADKMNNMYEFLFILEKTFHIKNFRNKKDFDPKKIEDIPEDTYKRQISLGKKFIESKECPKELKELKNKIINMDKKSSLLLDSFAP